MNTKTPIKLLCAFSIFNFWQGYSQDFIKKSSGELMKVKIQDMSLNAVSYKPFDNLNAPDQSIAKIEISEIRFANGRSEYFGGQPAAAVASLEETKQFIMEEINAHGYDAGSFDRRYKATFEGDYLRLTILKKNGEPTSDSKLYDFANVYRLSGTDRRSDELSFINMYVSYQESVKRNTWDKMKITIRVDSDAKAESIFNAIKHYHALLTKKETGDSKF